MPEQPPQRFVFYIAATPEKVWEGLVSPESNRILFTGAELRAELKPGGRMDWVGPDKEGKETTYVGGKVLQADAPRLLAYTFAMGGSPKESRVTVQLVAETEATQVTVTHDEFQPDDPMYGAIADGWPRILSRLKTLIETGKTFRPH
jgi:uncharacterized protein YndB with AHSA1/START domain